MSSNPSWYNHPLLGVILFIALTVILAAVLGTFVLDLGQQAASGGACSP